MMLWPRRAARSADDSETPPYIMPLISVWFNVWLGIVSIAINVIWFDLIWFVIRPIVFRPLVIRPFVIRPFVFRPYVGESIFRTVHTVFTHNLLLPMTLLSQWTRRKKLHVRAIKFFVLPARTFAKDSTIYGCFVKTLMSMNSGNFPIQQREKIL